jgi:hypothetical protein
VLGARNSFAERSGWLLPGLKELFVELAPR